jgi:osmotically-inducible protein OsmY
MAMSNRTDEAIQTDVLEELKWDTRVQPGEIGVAVKDGIVTLTGWVDSYLKKSLPNAPMLTLSPPCLTS